MNNLQEQLGEALGEYAENKINELESFMDKNQPRIVGLIIAISIIGSAIAMAILCKLQN